MHILVCVVNANTVSLTHDNAMETIQDIRDEASELGKLKSLFILFLHQELTSLKMSSKPSSAGDLTFRSRTTPHIYDHTGLKGHVTGP